MNGDQLLQLAGTLVTARPRNSVGDRRAVSTAYYTVFHSLAQLCADELLGKGRRHGPEYERVYQALDHASLRTGRSKI